jgi:PAS domain S-box-containing protein
MSGSVIALKQNDSLKRAVTVFSRHSIDSAPVVDERNFLKGVFSKSELFTAINEGGNLDHTIKEHMTVLAPYVYQDQRAEELIDRPEEKFAVVDQAKKLVGVITKTDVLKAYLSKQFHDITEYQALIDELASERHLREVLNTVLEMAYDGILVTDTDGYITMISDTYKRFLGVEDQDVIGKHCTEVVENTRMHIVAQTGKPEIANIQKIKGKHMIASRLPIIRDGKVVGVVGKVLFRDVSELNALVKKVRNMEKELEFYRGELHKANRAKYCFSEIIGVGEVMFKIKELAQKAAECSSNVLLLGESGTGKELFAHAIHTGSERSAHPLVKINCAAIPNDLLEAELFGYADGAFTGAKKGGKAGKFELAQGGTVFLDEIGDMPLQMQAKLLRVLQEREIEPIGSGRCKEIDVRIIAATNQNLDQLVREGKFREDLYHRLNVFTFTIPPLRDRTEDIGDTSRHILEKICRQMNKPQMEVSPRALSYLEFYHWPGNVRELYNVLERAVSLAEAGETILPEHLPPRITGRTGAHIILSLQEAAEKAEREVIVNALKVTGGNKTKTCNLLKISRSTLYERISKYDINI